MQGYRDIGLILMNAREERRLSITDVAKALHIRPRYIEALEEGNLEGLPEYAYVKGYLKRYAIYLALDKVEILRRFELVVEQAGDASFFKPHTFSLEKRVTPDFALISAAVLVLFLFIWALWLRPEQTTAQLVEQVPEKIMPAPEPPKPPIANNPCAREQERLYPPCYLELTADIPDSIMYRLR